MRNLRKLSYVACAVFFFTSCEETYNDKLFWPGEISQEYGSYIKPYTLDLTYSGEKLIGKTVSNLTLYANNYFTQTEEEPFKYFNYSSHSTGHTFEAGAGYMLSEKFPLSVSWYTTFAGNDYRENGKRAWSSYCELSYPFSVKDVNMNIEAGFTPWESMYSDKFNVVNIGLSATKDIKITSNFSLPIFGKLIANPYEEQLYFVVGITL